MADTKYVLCIDNRDYPDDLALHKVYRVLADEMGDKAGMIRIIDETGEDYLFDSSYFVEVQLTNEAEEAMEGMAA